MCKMDPIPEWVKCSLLRSTHLPFPWRELKNNHEVLKTISAWGSCIYISKAPALLSAGTILPTIFEHIMWSLENSSFLNKASPDQFLSKLSGFHHHTLLFPSQRVLNTFIILLTLFCYLNMEASQGGRLHFPSSPVNSQVHSQHLAESKHSRFKSRKTRQQWRWAHPCVFRVDTAPYWSIILCHTGCSHVFCQVHI